MPRYACGILRTMDHYHSKWPYVRAFYYQIHNAYVRAFGPNLPRTIDLTSDELFERTLGMFDDPYEQNRRNLNLTTETILNMIGMAKVLHAENFVDGQMIIEDYSAKQTDAEREALWSEWFRIDKKIKQETKDKIAAQDELVTKVKSKRRPWRLVSDAHVELIEGELAELIAQMANDGLHDFEPDIVQKMIDRARVREWER
ncbi:hypothetical protein E8E13_005923 [Curvularia kusanoi]|uniref:Uncharacterized protein n=1 Tax=Curvularia kusanoi TaxID=90978 RepID=A0A9P4T999_CURKU|nr:hypothetical protein E8E13_005923 [Curvularia kusanoi]